LTQIELNKVVDKLKSFNISPDLYMAVIKKYWQNVADVMPSGGCFAMARVKEAIQQCWLV